VVFSYSCKNIVSVETIWNVWLQTAAEEGLQPPTLASMHVGRRAAVPSAATHPGAAVLCPYHVPTQGRIYDRGCLGCSPGRGPVQAVKQMALASTPLAASRVVYGPAATCPLRSRLRFSRRLRPQIRPGCRAASRHSPAPLGARRLRFSRRLRLKER
jgi:hypothetical protein